MQWTPLPIGETLSSSDELPQMLESEESNPVNLLIPDRTVYDDSATPPNPTIGYGVNLRSNNNLAIVLNQITVDGANVFAWAAATGATQAQVVSSFASIIAKYPSANYQNQAQLETALSTQLSYWCGVPVQNTLFQITQTQATNILNEMIAGYTFGEYQAQSIYSLMTAQLKTMGVSSGNLPPPNSAEAVALATIYFNSPAILGPGIAAALNSGDRALVWYQIRYLSNGGTTRGPGIAKRRDYESQVFGLSSNTDSLAQAIQNYEMLTTYRPAIIDYEGKFGELPNQPPPPPSMIGHDGIALANRDYDLPLITSPSAPVSSVVQNLAQTFNADAAVVANDLTSSFPELALSIKISTGNSNAANALNVGSTDILVADSLIGGADISASALDPGSSNHILIGSYGLETLTGGEGRDLLVAGSGNETLNAGKGAETLVGGQGTDILNGSIGTDVFDIQFSSNSSPSSSTETIVSTNGNGALYLNGGKAGSIPLTSTGVDTWTDGTYTYQFVKGPNIPSADLQGVNFDQPDFAPWVGELKITAASALNTNFGTVNVIGFNLQQAQSSGSGFLGISLPQSLYLFAGANAGVDPPAPNFVAGSTQSYTLSVDAPSLSAQTLTISLIGVNSADFDAMVGNDSVTQNANGSFSFTLPAGQTSISFSLTNTTDVGSNATLQLSATLNNGSATSATSNSLTQSFVDPPDDPFTTPNAAVLYSAGTNLVTSGGLTYDSYSSLVSGSPIGGVSSGNNLIYLAPVNGSNVPQTNVSINGGSGNDTVFAYFGYPALDGGVNVIAGNGGQDQLYGGNDVGVSETSSTVRIYANTPVSLATAVANANTETATHIQGDLIGESANNSTIVGGNGNDLLYDDVYTSGTIVAGSGNDTILGGIRISYNGSSGSQAGLTWSTSFSNGQLSLGGDYYFTAYGSAEEISGKGAVPTAGYEGNYDSFGAMLGGGNDTIFGGAGNDVVILSNGNNTVQLGIGSAIVYGGMGNNTIIGDGGNNTIVAGGGSDYIADGSGNSVIVGRGGNNTIIGGSGNDTLYAGSDSSNWATAEIGNNYVDGGTGNAVILGSGGADTLIGGTGNSSIYGGAGSENIVGGAGNDLLVGGVGSDTIAAGGAGRDTLYANGGDSSTSILYGGDGQDSIDGGSGTNILYAGDGGTAGAATSVFASQVDPTATTTIYGGLGVDFLEGGVGSSVIYAGNGGTSAAPTSVVSYSGTDTLVGGLGTDFLQGGSGTDVLYSGDGGTTSAPTTVNGGTGVATLYGGAGSSLLEDGTSGQDLLVSASADDTLIGSGSDTLVAGTGNDALQANGGSVNFEFNPGFGNDTIYANGGTENLLLGSGILATDFAGSISFDGSGNSYLVLSGDGGSMSIENGLTGALTSAAYVGASSIPLQTLLTDVFGGDDTFTSGSSNFIVNLANSETVSAGFYNDTISSWGNNVTVKGGQYGYGDDIYSTGTGASIASGYGTDSIVATGANDTITGGSFGDHITVAGASTLVTTNSQYDSITASGSNDTLSAVTGNSFFYVNNASTVIQLTGAAVDDIVYASVSYTAPTNANILTLTGSANITATGNAAADRLTAGAGSDTLIAGVGQATLIGGTGNDTFVVNSASDAVQDSSTTTSNTIQSSVNYTLVSNVNTLVLTGTSALKGTANSGNDTLISNTGIDTLIGGTGNDTFILNNAADVVQDTAGTATIVYQAAVNFTLPATVNNLTLLGSASLVATGNSGNDVLTANAGTDTLVAGNGNDTLIAGTGPVDSLVGGTGNDLFVVNSTGDIVTVGTTHGTDTIQSSVTYSAPANVADLTLTGTSSIAATGNSLANILTANAGTDTLTAGSGLATLVGGAGNDTFVLNNVGDVIQDTSTTSTNTIEANFNYVLPSFANNLILTGTSALTGTANGNSDVLTSNAGIDTLVGGSGNDTFLINNTSDVIQDTSATALNAAMSSVSFTLPTDVNALTLTGTAALIATGNSANDVLSANTGADTLIAGNGNDTLVSSGSAQVESLVGGTGNDVFVVNNGADVVSVGGTHGADTIQASVSYTLPTAVNTLTLTGSGNLTGVAVSGNNSLTGNAGNDILIAGTGSDTLAAGFGVATLIGGTGADTFVINSASDVLESLSTASNSIVSSISYTLPFLFHTSCEPRASCQGARVGCAGHSG